MVGIAVVIVVVLVVGVAGVFVLSDQGILDLDFQLGQITGGIGTIGQLEETPTTLGIQNFDGNLAVKFIGEDEGARNIQANFDFVTSSDAYDTTCYERVGGTDDVRLWEVLDVGVPVPVITNPQVSNDEMTIKIRRTTTTDNGITEMWCEIIPEVTTFASPVYVNVDRTIESNPRIDTAIFADPNLDQKNDWVFRVNLLDISATDPNVSPSLDIRLKFILATKSALNFNLLSTVPVPTLIMLGVF